MGLIFSNEASPDPWKNALHTVGAQYLLAEHAHRIKGVKRTDSTMLTRHEMLSHVASPLIQRDLPRDQPRGRDRDQGTILPLKSDPNREGCVQVKRELGKPEHSGERNWRAARSCTPPRAPRGPLDDPPRPAGWQKTRSRPTPPTADARRGHEGQR